MKRALVSAMVLGILTVSSLTAQHGRFNAGAGPLVSAVGGSFGWHVMGAGEWTIPRTPLGLRVDGMYSRIRHDIIGNPVAVAFYDSYVMRWYGGTASLVYHIGTPILPFRLYALAGVGYLTPNGSDFNPTFVGGTGLSIGVGRMKLFAEGRFMRLDDGRRGGMSLFPIATGLSFGTP